MAITTTNQKLAMMELDAVWEPGLPISPGALGQDDRQQLLWGYPGILWASAAGAVGNNILDLNTRLSVFLNTNYAYSPHKDINALVIKYLAEEATGDYANRYQQLEDDATA